MKKSIVINIIGGLIIAAVFSIAVIFALVFSGILSLEPQRLVLASSSIAAVYDGDELTDGEWYIAAGELKAGHTIDVQVTGTQTNVGISDNHIFAVIRDENGADVSGDYAIEYRPGTINVKARAITIVAASKEKQYDGTPLTASSYTLESKLTLVKGHSIEVDIEGSITDVGSEKNCITNLVIRDEYGVNVTRNYKITAVDGNLVVYDSETLVVRAMSAEKDFDGAPLTKENWQILKGELHPGDSLIVECTGTQTLVGTSENPIKARIVNGDGEDVTDSYTMVCISGTLTVYEAEITVKTESDQKVYDGTPLKNGLYRILPNKYETNNLLVYYIDVDGEQTDVGVSENTVNDCYITDREGNDITENFNISYDYGSLRVCESEKDFLPVLTITTNSATKMYDGKPLTDTGWAVEGNLKEGHTVIIKINGSRTEVGTSLNTFNVIIADGSGKDVSSQYMLKKEPGELSVIPSPIKITASSAEKIYDGTPLESPDYVFENGNPNADFENEFSAEVGIYGSRIEVGTSDNTVGYYKIYNSKGVDVTNNFVVETYPGELTVLADGENMGGEGDGSGGEGDGSDGEGGSGGEGDGSGGEGGSGGGSIGNGSITNSGGTPSDTLYFTVIANSNDTVYLKMMSYLDYDHTAKGWTETTDYGFLTEDGFAAYYITALALKNSGLITTSINITPESTLFALPYYAMNGGFDPQMTDYVIIGSAEGSYNVNYYNFDGTAGAMLPSKYKAFEAAYAEYVKSKYLSVDAETLAYLNNIIRERGFSATDPDIINKVAKFIKASAMYNLMYDKAMDNEDNIVIAFLENYKEGVCVHYATAATLLFRALGIPARYTVGFTSKVSAGVKEEIRADVAHAWVEVYINGMGWVNVEVTGSGNAATGTDGPIELEITPVFTGDVLKGQMLTPKQEVSGFKRLADEGYTYEVEIAGSRRELGYGTSVITQFRIYSPTGKLVYDKESGLGSEKYIISYKDGTLHLYISQLKFQSNGKNKVYDAEALETLISDCYLASGGLSEGYSFEITPTGTITDVGEQLSTFKVKIYKDGVDCTAHYSVSTVYGKLVISARVIKIKAADATKQYDGKALVCSEIIYDEKALANGDYIKVYKVSGSQTNVGKSANVITEIQIFNSQGQDVTKNYSIETAPGTLTVTVS